MSGLTQGGILRWKEWIPLVTQQLRLRNLIQVTAYNIQIQGNALEKKKQKKLSYYYTLHLTAMSAPFYTSEQLESENPKWRELDMKSDEYGSANGVVIRLWKHVDGEEDEVITVWGVYFSGLVHIGAQLGATDASSFSPNSVVLHMHGGYFTAAHCFLSPHPVTPRTLSIQLSPLQVKPSYSLKLLLTLQSLKHAIKKESQATCHLREEISAGMFAVRSDKEEGRGGSAALRKLLRKEARPRADPREVHAVKTQIEMAKFRVHLLTEQRDILQVAVQKKLTQKNNLSERNQDRESELMENFCCLRRDAERKRELKLELNECKTQLIHTTALLEIRRRELISQLSYIYPIAKLEDGRYTIREVHLPNSEDFEGKDELMVSVALGFVAHLVQMISYFLDVPTRYPICHFGSRSKIIDHITDNIPDKEREFPLYSRGKEKHSFNYGVYLLNKNIAQLRWYCGLTTSDLRHTLPNLHALMDLNRKDDIKRCIEVQRSQKKSYLSFSLDQGLNNVAISQVNSDPQHYTMERRRVHTEGTSTPIHDLASLMLLDIPNQSTAPQPSHQANSDSEILPYRSSLLSTLESTHEAASDSEVLPYDSPLPPGPEPTHQTASDSESLPRGLHSPPPSVSDYQPTSDSESMPQRVQVPPPSELVQTSSEAENLPRSLSPAPADVPTPQTVSDAHRHPALVHQNYPNSEYLTGQFLNESLVEFSLPLGKSDERETSVEEPRLHGEDEWSWTKASSDRLGHESLGIDPEGDDSIHTTNSCDSKILPNKGISVCDNLETRNVDTISVICIDNSTNCNFPMENT